MTQPRDYPQRGYGQQPPYPQQGQPYPQQGQPWPQQGYPGQPQPVPGAPGGGRRRKRHTVRNILIGAAGLIVVVIAVSVAASGGHSVRTTGSAPGAGAQGGAAPKTAGIGSAITLSGNASGEQMAVTVTKVIASARPGDAFTSAPARDRLYAVQFRLRDTGSAAYSDAPSNGAAVTDSAGQSYQAGLADTAAGCQAFPATENIAPGASGLGCIVFEVPKSAKITQVQFTLDSGFGPDTGQWNVG